jgi:hypothetical protein
VVGPLAWHIVVAEGVGIDGVPTVGVTVTVVDAEAEGPLQPLAVTLTVAVPENPAAQVTVAVVPVLDMVFPAPVTDQLKLVALVADVE